MAVDPATLSRLIDAGDIEGVLALVSLDEIAEAWCQWSVRQSLGEVPLTTDESDWFSTDLHWWALEFWWAVSDRGWVGDHVVRHLLDWLTPHASTDRETSRAQQAANEEVARELLVKLVDHAPSDDVLGNVGAGPLEDFIDGDDDRVRWIEEQAASSPKFRTALAKVWIWSEPAWVFERVERAAGVPLAWPGREQDRPGQGRAP
jgi:hypothetical protein